MLWADDHFIMASSSRMGWVINSEAGEKMVAIYICAFGYLSTGLFNRTHIFCGEGGGRF